MKFSQANQSYTAAQNDLRQANTMLANYKKVQKDLQNYKEKYSDYDPDLTMLFLLAHVRDALAKTKLDYIEPKPLEYKDNKDYIEIPITIKAAGSYDQFVQFFQTLRDFYPLPAVRNVNITSADNGSLDATFDLIALARPPVKVTRLISADDAAQGKTLGKNPFGWYVNLDEMRKQIDNAQQGIDTGGNYGIGSGLGAQGKLRWPLAVAGKVTDAFGERPNPFNPTKTEFHYGIDIAADTGTPVLAVAKGKVLYVGPAGDYGNTILIQHENGDKSLYGHLSEFSVRAGQTVEAGTQIGLVGSTGRSTGPHLHFGYAVNNHFVDPTPYIGTPPAQPASGNSNTIPGQTGVSSGIGIVPGIVPGNNTASKP